MLDVKKMTTRLYKYPEGWKTHTLKTWIPFYERLDRGDKTAEIRLNDRDFKVGDHLNLLEFDQVLGLYTGASHYQEVTDIVHGPAFGIAEGYVVMSVSRLPF